MKVQSFSDIITNSSSELFVFNDGKSVEDVIHQLDEIYPDWRREYNNPVTVKDASQDNIETYQDYSEELYWKEDQAITDAYGYVNRYADKELYKKFDRKKSFYFKHAKTLGYSPAELYSNWDNYNPLAPYNNPEKYDHYIEFSPLFYELFKNKHKGEVMLFSKGENPNWDYQEKIECVATRYHLG